jgi:hypothetical protein
LDKKEWDNVGWFLRSFYGVSDDTMKAIAGDFYIPEKKKKAV